jgi:CMP-N-acetylneuraminic acid synthetase
MKLTKTKLEEIIKEEYKKLNEGPAYDYAKVTSQLEKSYKKFKLDVDGLQKILDKKGLKKEAQLLKKEYAKRVLGFQGWLRGFMDKLL